MGNETVSAASATEAGSRVDLGDARDARAAAGDCDYGRQCAAIHDVDPYEAVVNEVSGFLPCSVGTESEWGLGGGSSQFVNSDRNENKLIICSLNRPRTPGTAWQLGRDRKGRPCA